jgi:magnesium-protoporphyrin IX monomethyl ester (oxidative) cyclase
VNTPYPGTETWHTEGRRLATLDYRLFDVQHAVLPTRLPLERFYEELVRTQAVINRKHLGFMAFRRVLPKMASLLVHGQLNFFKSLWRFERVYNADRQFAEHQRAVRYAMRPPAPRPRPDTRELYVHRPVSRPA